MANNWLSFVKDMVKKHPGKKLKEVLKIASHEWKKQKKNISSGVKLVTKKLKKTSKKLKSSMKKLGKSKKSKRGKSKKSKRGKSKKSKRGKSRKNQRGGLLPLSPATYDGATATENFVEGASNVTSENTFEIKAKKEKFDGGEDKQEGEE